MRRAPRDDRGYDAYHRALREQLRPDVEAGRHTCARCHRPIHPGEPWDLDHTDDRHGYIGPSHQSCNRRAGALKRNGQPEPPVPPSRKW